MVDESLLGLLLRGLEVEVAFHLLRNGFARGGVDVGVVRGVVPAAGVGAGALVGVAVVEVAAEQAPARVRNAQRAVHKHFQLHVGAFLADFSIS